MIARSLLTQTAEVDIKIFYSYARHDESWRKKVDGLLPQFEWDLAVRTWYAGEIEPGTPWEPEIDRNLRAADVILLFISQAFIDSRYCREVELPVALSRHANGEARVVPIILEETTPDWRQLDFARLQVLSYNGDPVRACKDPDRALEVVVQGLIDLLVRQGVHHGSRMRWEIHLEGAAASFTRADRLAVTMSLRRLTGDNTLRCVDVDPGCIVLAMESTQDALERVAKDFEKNALERLGRWRICAVVRLFGAGVRAESSTAGSSGRALPSPTPESMLLPSSKFEAIAMKGISPNEDNPLQFDSLIDCGDCNRENDDFNSEVHKLLDYFSTCLAVPVNDMYVNLSPLDDAKLISESLRGTRLGAALLEMDYRLKRLSASLLHPDVETGQAFWREVRQRLQEQGVKANMPLAAFQRVWIVPEKADVCVGTRESMEQWLRPGHRVVAPNRPSGYVVEQRLKAVTERQYFAGRGQDEPSDQTASLCDQVFREWVLPVVEREVNEGRNFAELRQIMYSLILATWFKRRYRDHPKVAKFIDSGQPKLLGDLIATVESWRAECDPPTTKKSTAQPTPWQRSSLTLLAPASNVDRIRASAGYGIPENRDYFERYLQLFEHGVFRVEREEVVPGKGLKQPRMYFAGAIDLREPIPHCEIG